MTDEELTVQQAAKELGIKPGTVRKAFRHGRLGAGRRYGNAAAWSFLLLRREDVEHYRRSHLGRRLSGATGDCTECGKPRDHEHAATPLSVIEGGVQP